MVNDNESICPDCGGRQRYYDKVKRIIRTKWRKTTWVKVKRFRCEECRHIHRKLPNYIFPYKQYETEVIVGVLEGFITPDTLGFEDYPCEMTMKRWRNARDLQVLLWK